MLSTPKLLDVGQPIPDAAHAVSVSLPSWDANVGYEEGAEWVLSRMKNGYPRFFINLGIRAFADAIVEKYGDWGQKAMLFPTTATSIRCLQFIEKNYLLIAKAADKEECQKSGLCILDLVLCEPNDSDSDIHNAAMAISAVLVPNPLFSIATKFWQHVGDGISSRRAEFFHQALTEGRLRRRVSANIDQPGRDISSKGPRRYRRPASGGPLQEAAAASMDHPLQGGGETQKDGVNHIQFVEERFGRNLDVSLARNAKVAIRRRIAGKLEVDVDLKQAFADLEEAGPREGRRGVSENDVYLYPTGMSSIYNIHRTLLKARGYLKSVMFGFPYIDTLKILEQFGPGSVFYGHGSSAELEDLEIRCELGEKFLALFCEFPGNPLLKTPNLQKIRELADRFGFAVVVDETIGNFLNVNVLPSADVVVSSLTKVFSGDSNVMGGSCVLNPCGKHYEVLRGVLDDDYEDTYWPEDAIFMERNSRDFISRNGRINQNAEELCGILRQSPIVKEVYYPKFSSTRPYYDAYRNKDGGYGGLFSVTFYSKQDAMCFFDALDTAKGPSLGTNFTLSSPFVLLAHYNELQWAAQYGAEADLVRVSVGLEETSGLASVFAQALAAVERLHPNSSAQTKKLDVLCTEA